MTQFPPPPATREQAQVPKLSASWRVEGDRIIVSYRIFIAAAELAQPAEPAPRLDRVLPLGTSVLASGLWLPHSA